MKWKRAPWTGSRRREAARPSRSSSASTFPTPTPVRRTQTRTCPLASRLVSAQVNKQKQKHRERSFCWLRSPAEGEGRVEQQRQTDLTQSAAVSLSGTSLPSPQSALPGGVPCRPPLRGPRPPPPVWSAAVNNSEYKRNRATWLTLALQNLLGGFWPCR